jgi:hypothetical protein
LGPQFAQLAQLVEAQPDLVRFLAFGTKTPTDPFPPLVYAAVEHGLSVTSLDEYGDAAAKEFAQLLPGSKILDRQLTTVGPYAALRMVVLLSTSAEQRTISFQSEGPDRLLLHVLKLGNVFWDVEMTMPVNEFPAKAAVFDQAIQSFRNEFVEKDAASADQNAACGPNSDVQLVGDSPIGHRYQAGEAIIVRIQYDAPGCTVANGYAYGFHAEGTDWYRADRA